MKDRGAQAIAKFRPNNGGRDSQLICLVAFAVGFPRALLRSPSGFAQIGLSVDNPASV
jgi:hypothetical protein